MNVSRLFERRSRQRHFRKFNDLLQHAEATFSRGDSRLGSRAAEILQLPGDA